jgi:hypothetical protein
LMTFLIQLSRGIVWYNASFILPNYPGFWITHWLLRFHTGSWRCDQPAAFISFTITILFQLQRSHMASQDSFFGPGTFLTSCKTRTCAITSSVM